MTFFSILLGIIAGNALNTAASSSYMRECSLPSNDLYRIICRTISGGVIYEGRHRASDSISRIVSRMPVPAPESSDNQAPLTWQLVSANATVLRYSDDLAQLTTSEAHTLYFTAVLVPLLGAVYQECRQILTEVPALLDQTSSISASSIPVFRESLLAGIADILSDDNVPTFRDAALEDVGSENNENYQVSIELGQYEFIIHINPQSGEILSLDWSKLDSSFQLETGTQTIEFFTNTGSLSLELPRPCEFPNFKPILQKPKQIFRIITNVLSDNESDPDE